MVMLGASCSPCCQPGCGGGKDTSDPADEGDWVPSGSWPDVSWTFTATASEKEWFFYGSASTSRLDGNATVEETRDWNNICNWYSASSHAPNTITAVNFQDRLIRRASVFPTSDAIIHVFTAMDTVEARTVKSAYFYGGTLRSGSSLTATVAAFGTSFKTVFINGTNSGTVNGGALFAGTSGVGPQNNGTVNDGGRFQDIGSNQGGTVNGGAEFFNSAANYGTVFGGATFNDTFSCGNGGTVNGGATFNQSSRNSIGGGTVNGGAVFNNSSRNNAFGVVNDGAVFNNSSRNAATVNGGATFNNTSEHLSGRVNGGATFNDSACSRQTNGGVCLPTCTRKFVAHPTDLPTCNGTAATGCATSCSASCGCN
jgi:hypothetical protein